MNFRSILSAALLSFSIFAPLAKGEEPNFPIQPVRSAWPSWFVQTSPIGMLAKRYNLQVGHFFTENFALSAKYTHMDYANQSIFGHDDGDEVGLRASWYYTGNPSSQAKLGLHAGLFYVNFIRGDDWLDSYFTTTYERESKSPMVELMVGPILRINEPLTLEFLAGLQTYRVRYFERNRSLGTRTEDGSAETKVYAVLEINLGITF